MAVMAKYIFRKFASSWLHFFYAKDTCARKNKLKNENFVNNAPDAVVEKEKQKIKDAEQKIESIKKSIAELS